MTHAHRLHMNRCNFILTSESLVFNSTGVLSLDRALRYTFPTSSMPAPLFLLKTLRQVGLPSLAYYAAYKIGLRSGYYRRLRPTAPSATAWQPLFSLPDRQQMAAMLGEAGQRALLAEAEEVLNGFYRPFGGELAPLRLEGDWPASHWTEFESGAMKFADDPKFIWEPARFGWAFTLGRAYHLTQEPRYRQAFLQYFHQFMQANPPWQGPQWVNGQEVALRLIALLWAAHVFQVPANEPQWLAALHAHAERIPPTLGYARAQNNNHLISEAAALYSAGLALQQPRWRALGWRWLNWALQHQISEYGEYIQHSTNYHRLMLQAALWVNLIRQDVWPWATTQSLRRASHWLFSLLDLASGQTPNLGANDGALIFPLSASAFNDFRPTVQAAARAFLQSQITPGPWDELSLWFGLSPVAKIIAPEHYLSDNLHGPHSWAYLRTSTFRSRLGHMDQLHLDLWWRGLNIARDAGTYRYNAPPPWDNPLVSTRVHNTVMVDERDQMLRGGRFLTLDWFPAYSRVTVSRDPQVLQSVTAHHDGYGDVHHERTVTVYADERWQIADRLSALRPHTYRLHWLLPDWEWTLEERDGAAIFTLQSPAGWVRLRLHSQPALPSLLTLLSLVRAGEVMYGQRTVYPFEGWYSPTYGMKLPALSLALNTPARQNITLISEFTFE